MRIVDAHSHLGDCRIVDAEVGERELISALDANGVDLAPVLPFPGASDPAPCTTRSPSSAAGRGARGIVSLNPHRTRRWRCPDEDLDAAGRNRRRRVCARVARDVAVLGSSHPLMPERVGVDRLVVGSDALENVPLELANYRSLALEEPARARCLGSTADEALRG